jgi:mono/diheme cytochrome c family protein
MNLAHFVVLGSSALFGFAAAASIPGDAQRGSEVFKQQNCVACHSVAGQGGKAAPDLGLRTAREYTPAQMASQMWNHAPAMWTAIAGRGFERPVLSEDQAADLFAYFYSARYFERPGDAGRGKLVFSTKRCGECHGISTQSAGGASPVAKWRSLSDPIALAEQMWNHSASMRAAAGKKGVSLGPLRSQELTDLLVYLQNLPELRRLRKTEFAPGPADTGEMLYRLKGCADCHKGKLTLDRFSGRTLTDFAAAMWNHAPEMGKELPELRPEEMRRLVGYLWSIQFFGERGDPARGKRVFTAKSCAACHGAAASGAPNLGEYKGRFSATAMVAALWRHGPAMLGRMNMNKVRWPTFTRTQMADLIAYLNQG